MKTESSTSVSKSYEVKSDNFKQDVSKSEKTSFLNNDFLSKEPSKTGAIEKNLVNRDDILGIGLKQNFAAKNINSFKYDSIQGVKNNKFVTAEFIQGVEGLAQRIGTRPEYLMSVMSFESGGTFNPAKKNGIGATGLIQFLPSTAKDLGTTTDALSKMSSTEQLKYVEKYFEQSKFTGKLGTLEGLYTAVLSGRARQNSDDVLFTKGTKAYDQNPLDWNKDGKVTAGEAVTPVAARMYGGVKAVQQKLVDGGFVPAEQVKKFADGAWGKNTSTALSKFQAANNLPATGLLDDKTGQALFGLKQTPTTPVPPTSPTTSTTLKKGSKGSEVEKLQDNLIKLGFMTEAQKTTGAGIFGPRTENALKEFQTSAKLPANGILTVETAKAMSDISKTLGKSTDVKNANVTKGIQDKLVELGYMTKNQVNTGYGTFGPKTEAAIKNFQGKNGIQQSGLVGNLTYSKLFSDNPNKAGSTNGNTGSGDFSVATNGRNYTVNNGILMTDSLRPRLQTLADRYFQETGRSLHVTSGYRPPARQAAAMANLIQNRGENYVRNLYANKGAVNEIISAYRNGGQDAMTRTIEDQVGRGVYISDHLRSRAVDLSTNANFNVLRDIVQDMGGSILNEGDHYHLEL